MAAIGFWLLLFSWLTWPLDSSVKLTEANPMNASVTDDLTLEEILFNFLLHDNESLPSTNSTTMNDMLIYAQMLMMKPQLPDSELVTLFKLEYYLRSASFMAAGTSMIFLTCLCLPKSSKFFVHKQLLVSYLVSETFTLLTHDDIRYRLIKHRASCVTFVVFVQYASLCFYMCMYVEGVHILYMLTSVFSTRPKGKLHITYLFLGWGIPLLITGSLFAAYYDDYRNTTNCYKPTETWILKGPIAAILSLSMLTFALISKHLMGHICGRRNQNGNFRKVLTALRSFIIIFPLLGLTFGFGFFLGSSIVFNYIFVAVNGCLGILLFIFQIPLDKQVRAAFQKDVLGHKSFINTGTGLTRRISKTAAKTSLKVVRHKFRMKPTDERVSPTPCNKFENPTYVDDTTPHTSENDIITE